ncbi:hypothetical protein J0S82_011695 [Galemys pyrenaicus]|uniref:Translin-associated factor X-interacting protein 1 N-terminal domain-containing protein n=1 Tax=Galemys pyrenaicus TaxID=202257 RepID=A0A8J6DF60_GALPY|nr:hypothetical protein J0S82_011695 [Galemys pyrenaicus]
MSSRPAHLPWRHCETPGVHTLCNLTRLLDKLQKGHRDEVQLYTTGHLNPDKLYRPPETILHHWANACRPRAAAGPSVDGQLAGRVAAMKDALAEFTVRTALSPRDGRGTPLFRYLNPERWTSEDHLAPQAQRAGLRPDWRAKEELRMPELKVLRYSGREQSAGRAAAPGQDRFRYVSSYLGGATRADQYRAFLRFQKDVLATRDLREHDFTGAKAAAAHEQKLARGLRELCVCAPQELGRLSIFSDVFSDICSRSLVFGEILKEIKDEYELYMAILLDTRPAEQQQVTACVLSRPDAAGPAAANPALAAAGEEGAGAGAGPGGAPEVAARAGPSGRPAPPFAPAHLCGAEAERDIVETPRGHRVPRALSLPFPRPSVPWGCGRGWLTRAPAHPRPARPPAQAFLDYLQGLERRPVKTPDVQQARAQLRQLVTAVRAALARNEG